MNQKTSPLAAAILLALATAPALAQTTDDAARTTLDQLIVTGTRVTDRTVAESASPIDIITPETLGGARYDAVEKALYLRPAGRGDFRCFLATATGYGTVGVRSGRPFLEVRAGKIDVARIDYRPPA